MWVDSLGRLNLKLTFVKGRWYCAEVVNTRRLGYGRYGSELARPLTRSTRTSFGALFTERGDLQLDHRADPWTYSGSEVPQPGSEQLRINLWLFRGAPPTDGKTVEVIVKRFTFTPAQ